MNRYRILQTLCPALAAVLLGLSGACGGAAECTVPADVEHVDWMRRVGCERDYERLWDDRDDAVFAHTRTVNWIIDREDGDRVYFIDSVAFGLHYYFAAAYLDAEGRTPVGTHEEFNLLNYRREGRRFVLGKLMTYVDQGLRTVELSAGDNASADLIAFAFRRVAGSVYDGDELYYRPVSARQEGLAPALAGRVPIIDTEAVFSGQSYQPLHQAVGYGTLRFARVAEISAAPFGPTDIVVLDRVPNDIAMVSGVITEEFQTPLSHVNLLSKNRGTPNMALRGAFFDPGLRALEGQLVRLSVGAQAYDLAPADPDDAAAFWQSLRPSGALVPDFDESVVGVVDLRSAGASDAVSVGAKAANLAEMLHIQTAAGTPVRLPDAPFAVPFSAYRRHLVDHGIDALIDQLLADNAAAPLGPEELEKRLFAIRWAIFSAPIDAQLLAELAAAMRARWAAGVPVRLRSSTNVEDLAEFSGAGLYTSAGASVPAGAEDEAAVGAALAVVWASAWNRQAFVEREFYRVDHERVRMAALVHPAFDGELANGVAVTINEFNALRPAYYINAQVGEVSVTNPTGLATPEQILYYTWYEEPEYEVITRSSLLDDPGTWPAGRAVLTDAELAELAAYLEAIHGHFAALYGGGRDFAMDVEWKLAPGRVVYIKQARPLARR